MGLIDVTILNTITGDSYTIGVNDNDSLSFLKFDVEMKCGFRMNHGEQFVFQGAAMTDKGKNLDEYGIENGSTIEVHPKP